MMRYPWEDPLQDPGDGTGDLGYEVDTSGFNPMDPNAGAPKAPDDTSDQTIRQRWPGKYSPDNLLADGPADSSTAVKDANVEEQRLKQRENDRAYSEKTRAESQAFSEKERARAEAHAEKMAAEARANREGPAPLSRIPKTALSPGNPYAGIDDSLARWWEEQQGSTKGGGINHLISLLRGNQPQDQTNPSLPGTINPQSPTPMSGRFTQPTTGAPAQQALSNIQGYGNVSPLEAGYYLPFNNPELGGTSRATGNLARSVGMNPDVGNPYVNYFQSSAAKLVPQAQLSRMLEGTVPDERTTASDVMSTISSGKTSVMSAQDLRAKLSTLKGRTDLTPSQSAVMQAFESDPNFALDTLDSFQNISPDYQKYVKQAQVRQYNDFLNQAPSDTNKGLLDFVFQNLR